MICFSGDIGASNSRLAIIELEGTAPPRWLTQAVYRNSDFENFEQVLLKFKTTHSFQFETACFGVAGPVKDDVVTATNLPWTMKASALAQFLKIEKAFLINDLEAIAYGIPLLGSSEIIEILPGRKSIGNQAVIAPGSGIGEAMLYWDGQRHRPFATEGGHCSFSPTTLEQSRLLEFLFQEYNHVSWERVLSGPGLFNIYRFLQNDHATGKAKSSAEITERALQNDPLCLKAITLFLEILSNEAGNLALKSLAVNGVFIAGGITPKLLKLLDRQKFARDFYHKGRMAELLKEIPVYLVLNDLVGILGAARFALLNN